MPTLLGLAGMEDKIPMEVQGKNYAGILLGPGNDSQIKPVSALFINMNSRGVYTGRYMFVVSEKVNGPPEVYCYDNERDPYQVNKISFKNLDTQTGEYLKRELTALLKNTNDKWYQEKTCSDFLSY
jgi:hypothetical protein